MSRGLRVGVLAASLLLTVIALGRPPGEAAAYTLHAPIYINGNANFTAANGVTGGSGTPADPYVIEGWEIVVTSLYGIRIEDTDAHFVIRDVYVHDASSLNYGVRLDRVFNGSVQDSNLTNWGSSLILYLSANITVSGSNLTSWNGGALGLSLTSNVTVSNNSIPDGLGGISINSATNTTIADNNISTSLADIEHLLSNNTTITGNAMAKGMLLEGVSLPHYSSHNITADNTVKGLPLAYYKDCSSLTIDGVPLGQLVLGNCTAVTVANQTFMQVVAGIQAGFVDGLTIRDSIFSSTLEEAIRVQSSRNVTVARSNVSGGTGILIRATSGARVVETSLSGATRGIFLLRIEGSSDVRVEDSDIVGNEYGIHVQSSTNVSLVRCNVSFNRYDGVYIQDSEGVNITGCSILSNDGLGIFVGDSTNGTIRRNAVSSNNATGIYLSASTNISVYHNTIASNTIQSSDSVGPENSWDDGYPSGGNYWSDYAGADDCSGPAQDVCPDPDGIGDTPYVIDGDSQDDYPLMVPCASLENCRPPLPPVMLPAELTGFGLENVTLSWLPSPDDGAGEDDVTAYEVWSGSAYDAAGAGYALLAALPPGTTSYVHENAGHGDPSDHLYQLRAVEAAGNATPAVQQAGKFARFLTAGMQLLSVPLEQANWSVDAVLQTLPWKRAWTYGSAGGGSPDWSANDPAKTWADLTVLDRTMGLWVEVAGDASWTVAGLVPLSTEIALRAGWNLIGYPSFVPRAISDVLAGVAYETVEGFAADPPYDLARLDVSDLMTAGNGYWILAATAAVVVMEN